MLEELVRSIPVFVSAMIKFILGPLGGYTLKLHPVTTALVTIAGMMTSVLIFTYFGQWIRTKYDQAFPNRKKIAVQNPKLQAIWKRFGLAGIALLTPIILTPIGGTILAVSSGNSKERIILYMLISATAWSVIFTGIIYVIGHQALPDWVKP